MRTCQMPDRGKLATMPTGWAGSVLAVHPGRWAAIRVVIRFHGRNYILYERPLWRNRR